MVGHDAHRSQRAHAELLRLHPHRQRRPNCPFDLGFRIAIACRMAVESYRQQRTMRWDPSRKRSFNASAACRSSMDFEYTPEQIQLRKAVREFAEAEIAPHVLEWDENADSSRWRSSSNSASSATWAPFFPKITAAPAWATSSTPSSSKNSRASMARWASLSPRILRSAATTFTRPGTEEQKQKYIPKLASGEWLGCWSLTEPEAGSDAAGTRTTAVRDGDHWVLNGAKTFTTNAHYADVCVAMAVTDRAAAQHGISAFILEKGMPGFRAGKKENKLGLRASATGEVIFSDCRLAPIAAPRQARRRLRRQPQDARWRARFHRRALHRHGPGRLRRRSEVFQTSANSSAGPSRSFRRFSISWSIWRRDLDAARLFTYRAGRMIDQGQRVTRESAMAKLFASEAAVRIANEAVQIHGGYGFIKDYPVEKFYRDVKLCTIGEGTSEIQRLVIARQF